MRTSTSIRRQKTVGVQKISNESSKSGSKPQRTSRDTKPAFRYKGSLGHFPEEAESYVFVKRQDPVRKTIKIVPEMVYPLEANRNPRPKHQVLEDDWRAFRSVFHNTQAQIRATQEPRVWGADFLHNLKIAGHVLRLFPKDTVQLLRDANKKRTTPKLSVYKNTVDPPSGYMYRHYKMNQAAQKAAAIGKLQKEVYPTPVTVLEGPYMDEAYIPHGEHEKRKWDHQMDYFDADVILGGPVNREIYIHNEPDAVSVSLIITDFSVPLPQRVINMTTHYESTEDATNISKQISLPVFNQPFN